MQSWISCVLHLQREVYNIVPIRLLHLVLSRGYYRSAVIAAGWGEGRTGQGGRESKGRLEPKTVS